MSEPEPVSYQVDDGIAILTTDAPPVNALGARVRAGLAAAILRATDDALVRAIVIACAGRTFFAGADISEFGKPPIEPNLRQVLGIIENSVKPVVCAIHGAALGGGLELALVSHFRVATVSAKLGLPEANIGILPGAGGTQRLPRLVGAEVALEMITSGVPIGAQAAFDMGLIDAMAPDQALEEQAVAFARRVVVEHRPLLRVRDRIEHLHEGTPEMFAQWRQKVAKRYPGFDAPRLCVDAVEGAFTLPFDEGVVHERALFDVLVAGSQAKALRYLFFAERQAKKSDAAAAGATARAIGQVVIVGASAICDPLAAIFAGATIVADDDATALAKADLIVECVPDTLAAKQALFRRLDAIAKPGAVLASTTTGCDLESIAAVTSRPGDVLGLVFSGPSKVITLLEIVKGSATSPDVLATAAEIARKFGGASVTALGCSIAGRLRAASGESDITQSPAIAREGTRLLDEGVAVRASDIDVVAVHGLGWPRYSGGPMFELDSRGGGASRLSPNT